MFGSRTAVEREKTVKRHVVAPELLRGRPV
jgi:hypothetical protein